MVIQESLEKQVQDLLIREERAIDLDEILELIQLEKTNYHKLMIVSILQDNPSIEKEYLMIDKKTRTFFKYVEIKESD